MKIKAKEKNGVVKVKMLLKHPMDSGRQKDKSGQIIPAHHITETLATYNGNEVFHAELGPAVSKNPFLAFAFKGKKGDTLAVQWVDNKGESLNKEAVIK